MISTEKKKQRTDCLARLNQLLGQRYDLCTITGKDFFKCPDGVCFLASFFPGENAIVIEYAEDEKAAAQNQLEDGDLFYLDDFSEEELFKQILKEIG